MIDVFTKQRFEAALPKHQVTGQPLWQSLGLREGEECYVIPVKPGVMIYVRSSVKADGRAAESAEDSIRCWLAADITGSGLGSKPSRWITRVNGWDRRMNEQLRTLWRLGRKLRPCTEAAHAEDTYATMLHARRVIKEGPNKGRWFLSCPGCGKFVEWLTEKESNNATTNKFPAQQKQERTG